MLQFIGPALGVMGGVMNILGAGKANKQLKALQRDNPEYQQSEIAEERLALAQQLLNARMPGSATAERNIYTNQANALGNIQRNASSGSQALALGMAAQAQTNQAFSDLGQEEAADYYNRLQNLTGAQMGMINEQNKAFEDQVRRWGDRAQIEGAQVQNRANSWKSLSELGFALGNSGLFSPQSMLGGGNKTGGGQGGGMPPFGGGQGGGGGASGGFDPKMLSMLLTGGIPLPM